MNKTKDEMIAEWTSKITLAHDKELYSGGASRMYDHLTSLESNRQKEIDELRLWFANRLWAVGNSAKNDEISYLVSGRQGGHRAWRELQEEAAKILETNAAATRVMVK